MKTRIAYLRQLIIVVFCILLINCKNSTRINNSTQSQTIQDTIVENQFLFSNSQPSNDTFKIINQSWYYYYCYGKFRNPSLLIKHYSTDYTIKKEITTVFNDPNMLDTLYRVSKNNSFIKYSYENSDEFEIAMKIVSCKITTPDFAMTNGLKIGMEKGQVLKIIFGNNNPEGIEKFDKIEIITALTGLWIDFRFFKDKLIEINIDSDMQVDRK